MFKRKLKLVSVTEEAPRKLRMSRGLKKAVSALERYAEEEKDRKSASRSAYRNSDTDEMWGV